MPQPPLTQEQIDYFAQECESSFKRGARYTMKRALVGYGILLIGVFVMYWNGQHVSGSERDAVVESGKAVSVAGCNRDYRSTERLVGLLQRAQAQTAVQHKQVRVTDAQFADAHRFYKAELDELPLPDCRKVQVTLTDDPSKPIVIPAPLHPPVTTVPVYSKVRG